MFNCDSESFLGRSSSFEEGETSCIDIKTIVQGDVLVGSLGAENSPQSPVDIVVVSAMGTRLKVRILSEEYQPSQIYELPRSAVTSGRTLGGLLRIDGKKTKS